MTDAHRSVADLFPAVYDELRRLAAAKLAGEAAGHTLDATALVHEAYLRLRQSAAFESKSQFVRAAAEVVVDQPIYVADAPIRLGALVRDGQRRLPLDGRLDELALYNRALAEREIQDLMKRRPEGKAAGLVAYYDFDDGAGQKLTDKSGLGNHGRLGTSGDEDPDDPSWVAGKESTP